MKLLKKQNRESTGNAAAAKEGWKLRKQSKSSSLMPVLWRTAQKSFKVGFYGTIKTSFEILICCTLQTVEKKKKVFRMLDTHTHTHTQRKHTRISVCGLC